MALVAPLSLTPRGSGFSRLGLRNTLTPCCSSDAVAEIYMACWCVLADPEQMPYVGGALGVFSQSCSEKIYSLLNTQVVFLPRAELL
jgi:hypothetical protein